MKYNPKDYYFKKAKKEGYLARSAYKLEEIDRKYKIFQNAKNVVDLGAAPGSWTQWIINNYPKTKIIAIDIQEIKVSNPNVITIQEDIYKINWEKLKEKHPEFFPVDVIVSDMAPKTTGIKNTDQLSSLGLCEMAFFVAQKILKPSGNFVCKIFESGHVHNFVVELRKHFTKVSQFKPKSTRKNSKETFIVALNRKI